MKPVARSVLGPVFAFALLGSLALAQDDSAAAPTESPAPEVATDTEAPSQEPRILGPLGPTTFIPPEPVEPPAPPVLPVREAIEYELIDEGRSIILQRVEPPEFVPPPPPAPAPEIDRSSPEFQAMLAAARAKWQARTFVPLSVTVYDHRISCLRWWQKTQPTAEEEIQALTSPRPPRMRVVGGEMSSNPGVEFEVWSSIDWNCFRDVWAIEAGGVRYEFLASIGDVDTIRPTRFGREPLAIPEHPPLPAEDTAFVVAKGDAADADALAFLTAMHEIYRTDSQRLWAEYEARQQARRDYAAWLEANPPPPRDTVLLYSNIVRPTPGGQGGQP